MFYFKYQNNKEKTEALNRIYEELIEGIGVEEVKRYVKEFPMEKDFNIAQHGNLLCYYYDIRKFLIDCGFLKYEFKHIQHNREEEYYIDDFKMWDYYKYLVGVVANYMINKPDWIIKK